VKNLEIKSCDIDAGKTSFWLNEDFALHAPFVAIVTLALGYENEESSSYFSILVGSRDGLGKLPEAVGQKKWVVASVDGKALRAKFDTLMQIVNEADDPILEAARYLDWEYAQGLQWDDGATRAGHKVGTDLSRKFFNGQGDR
jgi:hypothetical protein